MKTLHRNGYLGPCAPAFIQSSEMNNLKELKRLTGIRLVQLYGSGQPYDQQASGDSLTYAEMATAKDLCQVACYAYGVGPDKSYMVSRDANGNLDQPTRFVGNAHAAELKVHPYTFRAEDSSLPAEFRSVDDNPQSRGDLAGEIRACLDAGTDGLLNDQPGVIVCLREQR